MTTYTKTGPVWLLTLLLAPGLINAQSQSGAQPRPSTTESSVLQQLPATAEPIALETATGKLFGTLELPKSPAPFPMALIIAGSGPTDRDGNSRIIRVCPTYPTWAKSQERGLSPEKPINRPNAEVGIEVRDNPHRER